MDNPFTKHPKEIGESYLRHMSYAILFSIKLIYLSITVLIHSIFPFLFKTTTTDGLNKLNNKMNARNNMIDNKDSILPKE